MLDRPFMLYVKLPFADSIHPQSNEFVTGMKTKATGDSKLNDNPDNGLRYSFNYQLQDIVSH